MKYKILHIPSALMFNRVFRRRKTAESYLKKAGSWGMLYTRDGKNYLHIWPYKVVWQNDMKLHEFEVVEVEDNV